MHDPDSSAAEKAIALKIGRQKKIQIIDGQQVNPDLLRRTLIVKSKVGEGTQS